MQLTQNSQWEEFDSAVEAGEDLFELSFVVQMVSTERSATNLHDVHHTVFHFFIHDRKELNSLRQAPEELLSQSQDFSTPTRAQTSA